MQYASLPLAGIAGKGVVRAQQALSRRRKHRLMLAGGHRLEMPARYHPIDQAVFQRVLRLQNVIAVYIAGDLIHRLSRRISKNLVERLPHAEDLPGIDIDVRGLAAEPAHGRLVNQNPRMRQAETLALGTAGQRTAAIEAACPTQ